MGEAAVFTQAQFETVAGKISKYGQKYVKDVEQKTWAIL